MNGAYTFYFEEIFPTYESWKEFNNAYNNFIEYSSPPTDTDIFDELVYSYLSRHYNHCNIRYSDINSFKSELLNVYENKFQQAKLQYDILKEIYKLKPEDFYELNSMLRDFANNPNEELNSPKEIINYVSQQSRVYENGNKLEMYIKALVNIPSLNIYQLFKANSKDEMGFDDLFMNVQPNQINLYERSNY